MPQVFLAEEAAVQCEAVVLQPQSADDAGGRRDGGDVRHAPRQLPVIERQLRLPCMDHVQVELRHFLPVAVVPPFQYGKLFGVTGNGRRVADERPWMSIGLEPFTEKGCAFLFA